jgi:catechol 2,3-dioxygenase-like lactoylglutathione lyase family enzyme
MSPLRLDHVVVVVEDLGAATAFFLELGMEVEGRAPIEGDWIDRVNGMADVKVDVVLLRTPDGLGKLELTAFRSPTLVRPTPHPAPPNVLGYRSVMFEVDDVDEVVARLVPQGGELMGEITDYEDSYRLCYLRGPAGIIVALATSLRPEADTTAMTPDEVDGQVYGG